MTIFLKILKAIDFIFLRSIMRQERRRCAEGDDMPYRRTFLHTSTHKNSSIYRHTYSSKVKGTINMTEGKVFGKILLFALPLMVTNLLQMFYSAADMIIVSMSSEANAVGAIGMTGSFINLVVNVFTGFATGATVVVARNIGAKDDEGVSRSVHTSLLMSIMFGLASSTLGLFISRPVLSLMGAEGNLLDLSTTYTFIYFCGVPFIAVANYLISIFRAKGDTRTPLYVLSGCGLLNVLLNFFFVLVCDFSVEGVALATSISNAISAILLLIFLSRDEGPCRFYFKKLCLDKKAFRDILYVGLPAGIQGSLFSISNITIQSAIIQVNNTLAPVGSAFAPVVNGNAAANNLEGFAYTVQNSFYQAAITFTSQNVGAGKHERVYKIMRNCYLLGICFASLVAISMFFMREPLLSLYGVSNAAEGTLESIAFDTATKRMCYMFLPYFAISFMEVGCGIVRGLGKAISSTIISLLGACIFRVVWISTVFKFFPTLDVIYISYPISWILTGAAFLVYSFVTLKKLIKKRDEELLATK